MSQTLNERLREVLSLVSQSIETTEIISINASISASRMDTTEGQAFKVIAKQVRDLNGRAKDNLGLLKTLFEEIRTLTRIINVAGKQRMLAQKIFKLHLLIRSGKSEDDIIQELTNSKQEFESALTLLHEKNINTEEIKMGLDKVGEIWIQFQESLLTDNLTAINTLNNNLVTEMNKVVMLYQKLAG